MLEESKAAKTRLNRKRTKPLNLDCKYYFVDKESAHVDHLRRVLNERGFRVDDESIVVRNERFEEAIDDIIAEIPPAVSLGPAARYFSLTRPDFHR